MSYYNPLLGGGKAAAKNIVVGWGEGLDQVTDYLNAKPDADRLTLAGFYPRVLMAQFKGTSCRTSSTTRPRPTTSCCTSTPFSATWPTRCARRRAAASPSWS